jgi:hypothetical protein
VAFVAHNFPPLGGGGTPRSVKFVRFLPDYGWQPIVFTGGKETFVARREFVRDDSTMAEFRDNPPCVVRISESFSPFIRILKALPCQALVWAAAYPWLWDENRSWSRRTAKAVIEHHRREPFDVIYVSAPPFASLEIGSLVSRATGLPFVADMRDLWTTESHFRYPTSWHYGWTARLERRLLSSASHIIANTPGAAEVLRKVLNTAPGERISVIPNGFDPSEISDSRPQKIGDGRSRITFLHAGTLYEEETIRSRLGHYYPLPLRNDARSVVPMARALVAIRNTNPKLADRIQVRLLGYAPQSLRDAIDRLGMSDRFTFDGVVPRNTAMTAMQEADALVVLQFAFEDTNRPVPFIPGKVYEYLPTGKPILAPVPPGDLRNLLAQVPQAYSCDFTDTAATARAIVSIVNDIDAGKVRFSREAIEPYNRLEHVRQLAAVLDRAMSRGRCKSSGD